MLERLWTASKVKVYFLIFAFSLLVVFVSRVQGLQNVGGPQAEKCDRDVVGGKAKRRRCEKKSISQNEKIRPKRRQKRMRTQK